MNYLLESIILGIGKGRKGNKGSEEIGLGTSILGLMIAILKVLNSQDPIYKIPEKQSMSIYLSTGGFANIYR